jgi:tetratricopeptide (TPR) repeat protein
MTTPVIAPAYADAAGTCAMEEAQLRKFQADLGARHPDTLMAKNNLGITLQAQGQLARARELLETTLRDSRRVMGKHHPDTLVTMSNLALALYEDDEPLRALALQKKVLKWRRRSLGEEHALTLTAMKNLATMRFTLGDEAGARLLEEAVLKVRKRNLGDDHPDTLAAAESLACTLNNQAVALRNADKLDEAEPLQMEALALMTRACGDSSLYAAIAYSAAGALMKRKGDLAQAMEYFHKAIDIRERELGADAELTQLVKGRLREMLH